MSIFDDLKAKADTNGDGTINAADLEGIKNKLPADQFDKLKGLADKNADGKISLDDLKSFDAGSLADDVKGKLGDLFGKK